MRNLSVVIGAVLVAVAAAPLAAGSLIVNGAAAQGGAFGMQVNMGGPCAAPNELVIEPPTYTSIFGAFTACTNLTSSGVTVTSAGATFTAGRSISIGNGFVVDAGADYTAGINDSLDPFAFVVEASPKSLMNYTAIYEMNLDNLALPVGDELHNLTGYAVDGTVLFRVVLLRSPSPPENRLILNARLDSGDFEVTPFGEQQLIPAGSNTVEISWRANNGGGHLLASVNGGSRLGLTGLVNGDGRLDSVAWGAVSGAVTTAAGNFALDEFAAFGSADDPDVGVSISSTLDLTPEAAVPAYTAETGAQTGRLQRNGVPSSCGSVKANPGLFTTTGARQYDQYRFVALRSGCATVTLSGAGTGVLFSAAYDQNGLNITNPSLNYLADSGASPTTATPSTSYSFEVTAGQKFHVVVHEVNAGGGSGQSYTLAVEGVKLVPDFSTSSVLDTTAPELSPAYSRASGSQTGRLNRFSPASTCGSAKPNPGLFTPTDARRADLYVFTPAQSGCAVVTLSHSGADQAQIVVYNENGFVPSNPSMNYLADSGGSADNDTVVFSFDVTAGVSFSLVVHEVNPGAGIGDSYTLNISNVSLIPTIRIPNVLDGVPPAPQPEFAWASGFQTGRLNRFPPVADCNSPKASPGSFSLTGPRRYERFTFTPDASGCVQVTLRTNGTEFVLYAVAYDNLGFNPSNPAANYLADHGNSPNNANSRTFSFNVTAGVPFSVVVHEVNPGEGVGQDYTLEVGGIALGEGFELPFFEDGFESGDTSAWSGKVP